MDELLNALRSEGLDFVLYAWDRSPNGDYGVISLDSTDDLICDNHHSESGLIAFVDYFTRDSSLTPKATIEAVLERFCAYRLNSVQYEDDTKYIHYEWRIFIL